MSRRSVEHASFIIERRYDAPPHRVFAAWADPAAKSRWFARAEGWEADPHELDFREGGLEVGRSRMPGGPLHTYRAIYWEVIADQRIVYTYEMLIDDARISVSLVTVELSPDAGGTRLALTEHGAFFDGSEDPGRRRDGTGSLLEALARELKSQDDVEVVRRVYDAWNAGYMTVLRDLCHPDVVMHHPEGWPEPGPSVGREAVLRQWEQIREAWTDDTLEPVTDFVAVADRVVVRDAWRGTGQGPDADMEFTRVFTLRERKIIDIDIFWDHAAALEAVGRSE